MVCLTDGSAAEVPVAGIGGLALVSAAAVAAVILAAAAEVFKEAVEELFHPASAALLIFILITGLLLVRQLLTSMLSVQWLRSR